MKITSRQYARSLYDSVAGKSESEIKTVLKNFVALLARKGGLSLAEEILEAFDSIWNEENGELAAQLTSARELGEESRSFITDYVMKKSGAKNVVLEEKVDKDILGGFILKYQSKVIDGSLRNSLNELKNELES